jgi:hypothetical protein
LGVRLPELTPPQIREDLTFLRDQWANQDKSFDASQALSFRTMLDEAITDADHLDSVDFWMRASCAVALSRNGHTNINADNPPFRGLPFRAWWFPEGLHIVTTEPQHAEWLGARIEKVGRWPTAKALERVAPYISGNDRRRHALAPQYLRIPALLQRLGIVPSDSETRLVLRRPSGEEADVTFRLQSGPDPLEDDADCWSALVPSGAEGLDRWAHVLDGLEHRPSIYHTPVDLAHEWLDPAQEILYLRSNQVQGSDGQPLSLAWKLLAVLAAEVVPARPRCVIVDLRLNSGGNFVNSLLFAQALPKVLGPEGQVLLLVSESTFSAAIVTAALLKAEGGDRVRIIGSEMGDNPKFWAEGSRVSLPNSRLEVKPSWGFQDWGEPATDPVGYFWPNVVWGPSRKISLSPEIVVETTFADYRSGRDPVLEKAKEIAR